MSDIVRVKVTVCTNKVGSDAYCVLEFEREDWEGLSEEERYSECEEAAYELYEWWIEELEE